jgi:hypothetical protein
MQDPRVRPLPAKELGKARPLVTKRDYEWARKLVLQYVRQNKAQRDWDRTKALLREIAEYERYCKPDNGEHAVIWAAGVFAANALYAGPRRRRLDRPGPGHET